MTERTSQKKPRASASANTHNRVKRVFLDWDASLIDSAVQWLLEKTDQRQDAPSSSGSTCKRRPLIAFPSGRAIDRLRERLIGEQVIGIENADVVTVGSLRSKLFSPSAAFASAFEQTLAWTKVLRSLSDQELRLIMSTAPAKDAIESWMEIASTLRKLHTDVAAQAWMFSDVIDHTQSDVESKRWRALARWQDQYLEILADVGRVDLDAHTLANLQSGPIALDRPVLLVGTLDLPPLIEKLLQACSGDITSLIAMPASCQSGLNGLGVLKEEAWQDHIVPSLDDHFVPAQDVADQAHAVMESLANFGAQHSVDQITIGITDASLIEPIEAHCELLEVPTYRHLGTAFSNTASGRLLDLIWQYVERRSYASLAALIRHADVHAALDNHLSDPCGSWLAKLDEVMANHFPLSVDGPLPPACVHTEIVTQVIQWADQWLSPLLSHHGNTNNQTSSHLPATQRLGQWCDSLRQILTDFQSHDPPVRPSDESSSTTTDRSHHALEQVLDSFQRIPPSMDPPIDGVTAIRLVNARLADLRIPSFPSPEQIEILGWLDLALDDAPAMVIAGFNHPFVPEAVRSEPFLPDALRQSWQQAANAKRYARDVVAMHQIIAKRESIRLIVGQFAADGSPTPPSRLLSATDPNTAARRVCNLLESSRTRIEIESETQAIPRDAAAHATKGHPPTQDFYRLPKPEPGRTVSHLSVTSFSAYLTCPYRFYLRYVIGLRPVDDSAMELAANQFGDLVHGALEWFGETDAKDSTNEKTVREALLDELNRYAQTHYGDNAATTIAMQVRQAQRRLKVLAREQTQRAQHGWIIDQVEASVDEKKIDRDGKPKSPSGLWVDGEFTGIRGRFDRIDHHPDSGRWAILDYKTHAFAPEKKHLKKVGSKTQWIDLQLPLYRRLIPDLGIDADPSEVDLGYFNVADKDSETKVNLAGFSEEQFAEADELMHWCVRQIRECRFEPTDQRVQFDDYAEIMEGLA